mgnify:CR=1 FL=1
MVHTTASNAANPFIVRRLKKLQQMDELEGSQPKSGNLTFAESHESFLTIRKKIIQSVSGEMDEEEINVLAKRTRGMIERDIILSVENYLQGGNLPPEPTHPTNTCHPITGSWTEKLVSVDEYHFIFKNYYNQLIIQPGFYNEFSPSIKVVIYKIVNRILNKKVLTFSPFIFLTAKGNN